MKKSIILFLSIVLLFLTYNLSFSQQEMKYSSNDKPFWVKLMYSENNDPQKVITAYEKYYKTHKFIKNGDTQYYKRWLVGISRTLIDSELSDNKKKELKREQQRYLQNRKNSFLRSSNSLWTCIGPFDWDHDAANKSYAPGAAHVYTVEQSPSNPDILYCGTANAGIWKSDDHGLNWIPLTKDMITGSVTAIEISIDNPDIVYAEIDGGVWKTIDGGNNWVETGDNTFKNTNHNTKDIISHPTNSNTLFLATNIGLFKTTDGGNNWIKKHDGDILEIEIHPTDFDTIYFTKLDGTFTKFYRSVDQGETWIEKTNGWPSATGEQRRTEIAVSADEPDMVFALATGEANGGAGLYGVYISSDNGDTWSFNCCGPQPAGPPSATNKNLMGWSDEGLDNGGQYYYDLAFDVSPTNADSIFVGGVNLWISDDGGDDFTCPAKWSHSNKPNYVHADIHDIHYYKNTNEIWLAGDGGIFFSDDGGENFERRILGIAGSDFWGFGQGFWDGDVMLGGAYHNGTLLKDNDVYINGWLCTDGGDGVRGYVNQGREKYVFSDYNMKKLSGDRTVNYSTYPFNHKPNASYTIGKTFRLLFHPNYYDSWYTGDGTKLYRTENNGNSYELIHDFGENIVASALSDSDPNYIYVTTFPGWWDTKHIFRSSDTGETWTDITPSSAELSGDTWVPYDIDIDPHDPLNIWIVRTSMYGSTNLNDHMVYSSTDGGDNWQNETTSTLDGEAPTNIVYQKGTDDGLYIGTRRTVYYKNNQLTEWKLFANELPASANSVRLVPYYRKSKLRNATNQSVWEVDFYENSVPIAQPSVDRYQAICVNDTFYFKDHSILSENNVSWSWSFPGGNPSSSNIRSPKVVYSAPGKYDVTLTVTDINGTSTKTIENMIEVGTACEPDRFPGKALSMASSPDHAIIPDFNVNTNTFTITAWIKPDGIQNDYSAIFMNDGTAAGFNFREGNNTLGYHWPGGQWYWDSNLIVPADEWSYVAMVATPNNMTLYVNGKASIHNTNLQNVQFGQSRIGSYQGWTSRNFKGEIDEVCIWDRSLSQDEIRELRHLTKKPDEFPSLIAYYQFNNEIYNIPDKTGNFPANYSGNAGLIASTAPVGYGVSQRKTINSGGNVDFDIAGLEVGFSTSGTHPDGEVVVSRLEVLPNELPDNRVAIPNGYWIMNNYGNNEIFTYPDSIKFYDYFISNEMESTTDMDYILFKRSENEDLQNWVSMSNENAVATKGLGGIIQFEPSKELTSDGQFIITRNNFNHDTAAVTILQSNSISKTIIGGKSIALNVKGENQGIKLPILTNSEVTNLKSPPTGLIAFLSDIDSICYFDGAQWKSIEQKYISELNADNPSSTNTTSIGTNNHPSALLSLKNNEGGILVNQFTDIATTSVENPVKGMIMFRSNINKLCVFNGTTWIPFKTKSINISVNTNPADYNFEGISIGQSSKNPNAILEINTTDKLLLIPQQDYLQIQSPTKGLIIFDSNKNAILVFDGNSWQELRIE